MAGTETAYKRTTIASLGGRTGGMASRPNLSESFEKAPNANTLENFRQRLIERGQKPLPPKTAAYLNLLKQKGQAQTEAPTAIIRQKPKSYQEAKDRGNIVRKG